MFDKKAIEFLKNLTESFGPSGFEREPAGIIKGYMKPYSDEVVTDKLGSIVFVAKGQSEKPRILLAGHIDEIGFVVSGIDENSGFLSFNPIGGWWDQVLLSQKVIVRTAKGDVLGVIASKPPHLLTDEERTKVFTLDKMLIDIGATSKKRLKILGSKSATQLCPCPRSVLSATGRLPWEKPSTTGWALS